ncbi:MAG: phosphomannomutase [Actinomycetota bacterium]|nr:phosphomannomutase [Actinomycetota bacterium]
MDEATLHDLMSRATDWRDGDPDPRTRAELEALVVRAASGDDNAVADLADRFTGPLRFGTAGLRGALGAGPNRMNRAVVITAAAGLVAHLRARVDGVPHLVVGYDARYGSATFARDTCAVAVAAGCTASLLPGPLPTPVLAFAVRHLRADAGVMVTASHNPPEDNGYKVYLGGRYATGPADGVQIVSPADRQIAAAIAAAGPASDVPMADGGWETLDDNLLTAYLDRAVSVVRPGPRALSIVATPLHGVGGETLVRALTTAGFEAPYLVPEQAEPDPEFPTVAFPNPEEPGALDLALAAARDRGADLVIANDPDADRCAVAIPAPSVDGGWRALRGDELGWLLAEHLLSDGVPATVDGEPATVACSIVSSQMLGRIAAAHAVRHAETLTGFKWLARTPGLLFAYEEALGYCCAPDLVRDKDGITAALLAAGLAAGLAARGRTVADALDDLARAHGVHVTDQLAVRVDDLAVITGAMRRLRAAPPVRLGDADVVSVDDLLIPSAGLPPTDGLRLRTADGVRVVVRPSGTEPKLKCYLEAVVPVSPDASGAQLAASRSGGRQTLSTVRAELAALIQG